MLPTLSPGDRVVINALAYRLRSPRTGQIVVLHPPGSPTRLDIKRVAGKPGEPAMVDEREAILGPDEWYVTGDNSLESTDSRDYGPVRRADLVGPVWFTY